MKLGPPAVVDVGLMLVNAGAGLLMVKVRLPDVPPPGAVLMAEIGNVPPVAISAAAMAAVSFVLLTKVVVRSLPFQRTFEVLTKLVPVTVSVKPSPPAVAEVGLILVMVGAGLLTVKV